MMITMMSAMITHAQDLHRIIPAPVFPFIIDPVDPLQLERQPQAGPAAAVGAGEVAVQHGELAVYLRQQDVVLVLAVQHIDDDGDGDDSIEVG